MDALDVDTGRGGEVGVVYAPYLDECFFAARGEGAFFYTESSERRSLLRPTAPTANKTPPLTDSDLPSADAVRTADPNRLPFGAAAIPLRTTRTDTLIDAVLVSGFHYEIERYPNLDCWGRFLTRTRAVRRLGSAALDLAYVAAGRFDGFWETGLNPYDVAAGCLLIKEAGGQVTDQKLGDDWLWGRSLIATNGPLQTHVHEEIRAARQAE